MPKIAQGEWRRARAEGAVYWRKCQRELKKLSPLLDSDSLERNPFMRLVVHVAAHYFIVRGDLKGGVPAEATNPLNACVALFAKECFATRAQQWPTEWKAIFSALADAWDMDLRHTKTREASIRSLESAMMPFRARFRLHQRKWGFYQGCSVGAALAFELFAAHSLFSEEDSVMASQSARAGLFFLLTTHLMQRHGSHDAVMDALTALYQLTIREQDLILTRIPLSLSMSKPSLLEQLKSWWTSPPKKTPEKHPSRLSILRERVKNNPAVIAPGSSIELSAVISAQHDDTRMEKSNISAQQQTVKTKLKPTKKQKQNERQRQKATRTLTTKQSSSFRPSFTMPPTAVVGFSHDPEESDQEVVQEVAQNTTASCIKPQDVAVSRAEPLADRKEERLFRYDSQPIPISIAPKAQAVIDAMGEHPIYLIGAAVREGWHKLPQNRFHFIVIASTEEVKKNLACYSLDEAGPHSFVIESTIYIKCISRKEQGQDDLTILFEESKAHYFSANSLCWDPKKKVIIDFHCGLFDARNKQMRLINSAIDCDNYNSLFFSAAISLTSIGFFSVYDSLKSLRETPIACLGHASEKEREAFFRALNG